MASYDSLAKNQGENPALMIFRRFLPLNAWNLLMMQGELLRLEGSLKMIIEDDSKSKDPKRSQYQYNIGLMKGPHELLEDEAQWQATLEVRKLVKEYSYEAMLQVAALAQLAPVDKGDLSCVRELLENPRGSGRLFPQSLEYSTYDEENEKDLTSLVGLHSNKDMLTRWADRWIRKVYHKHIGHKYRKPISDPEAGVGQNGCSGVYSYSDSAITNIIDTFSTILASVLPTIAAFAIYFIHDQVNRMAAIVVCTLLFSTTLTLIARPKRVEVFTASAAFAAVLVVFVGNSTGSGTGNVS